MGLKSQNPFTVPVLLSPAGLKGLIDSLSTTPTVRQAHIPPLSYSPELTGGIAEPGGHQLRGQHQDKREGTQTSLSLSAQLPQLAYATL